ncbi:helix-turn-helix domain-containing protein [Arsenophonus apicola]
MGKNSSTVFLEMGITAIARQLKIVPSTVYKVLDN